MKRWDSEVGSMVECMRIDGYDFPRLIRINFNTRVVYGTSRLPIGRVSDGYIAEFTPGTPWSEHQRLDRAINKPSLKWRRPGGSARDRRKRRRSVR